jgi:predicted enzyme related to lactoylglutathione lyase
VRTILTKFRILSAVAPRLLVSLWLLAALGAVPLAAQPAPPAWKAVVAGLQIDVVDVEAAAAFYTRALGFERIEGPAPPGFLRLQAGALEVALRKVEKPAAVDYPAATEVHLNLAIPDVAETIRRFQSEGWTLRDPGPLPAAIGVYTVVADPSGNLLHLLQLEKPATPVERPRPFNIEVRVTDMKAARRFYGDQLGLEVATEAFFPPTIPLKRSGPVPLVIHEDAQRIEPVRYPDRAQTSIVLSSQDLAADLAILRARGVSVLAEEPASPLGPSAVLVDPFGNTLILRQAKR